MLLAGLAVFAGPAATNNAAAEDAPPRKPGDALIESLQNRSAVDRWILLRREQREQKKRNQLPHETETPVSASRGKWDAPGPALSQPFPEPGMKPPARKIEPSPGDTPIGAFSEPVRLEQRVQVPVPAPKRDNKIAESPDQLRKITEIMPYHDYSPDTNSKKAPGNKIPEETWTSKPYTPRAFENVLFTWEASDLYHNPLYFEDPALERYGHTYPEVVQPFASVGRFGLQLFGLPYQMTIDPICEKHYTLGWYRPGECAPKLLYQIPWNSRAAKVQAGVVTGMFFLIP